MIDCSAYGIVHMTNELNLGIIRCILVQGQKGPQTIVEDQREATNNGGIFKVANAVGLHFFLRVVV